MMKQFYDLKEKHPDAVLLFRMGDFYEAYCEDAEKCAKVLGITLTKSTTEKDDKGKPLAMTMFPYHALDKYLPKLIRAGHRVAICDQLEDPNTKKLVKRGTNDIINNSKTSTTMKQTITAQDYVGKTIVVGDNIATITIESVNDDMLQGKFKKGTAPVVSMPIKLAQLEKMLSDGIWKVGEGATVETKDEEPKTQEPTKTKTNTKTKADAATETTPKPKINKPKAKTVATSATLTYSTYTNKKGKVCGKITGFSETDEAYKSGIDIHGSATYERKNGNKVFMLIFGPRYAEAAKDVCEALNAGKSFAECKSIIDACTEERAKKREEWKRKAEEAKAEKKTRTNTKTKAAVFTEDAVRKAFETLATASGMNAKDFEPIIEAMKAAA